jgi:hypothetical protein
MEIRQQFSVLAKRHFLSVSGKKAKKGGEDP